MKPQLTVFNRFTGRDLMTVPLRGFAGRISYITHPNRTKKTRIGERPLSLAELLRMPVPLFELLTKNLTKDELLHLKKVVIRAYNNEQLDRSRYRKFLVTYSRVA